MLTTAEAQQAVFESMPTLSVVKARLDDAIGKVLRQAVCADRDQPPFDRVMMDGIAVRCQDLTNGVRRFPMQATQAAGDTALSLQPGACIEIMTGACLPQHADCIVPVERLSVADGVAAVADDYSGAAGQFIHPRASDHALGAQLLAPGKRITPMDIAVLASCGLDVVDTSRQPVISVISTGNELVPAGSPIEPHQVRLSNGPAIIAMLNDHGYTDCRHDHAVDDLDVLHQRIGDHLAAADVVILSGGVSMGKADFVPRVLADLGVEVVFHKVSQRPGKPMWFGIAAGNKVVFALPGNPVSALICCRQYVIPALQLASAATAPLPEFAALANEFSFAPELTCFLPVRILSSAAGQALAMPVKTNTSGDFTALSGSDGYVELAREDRHFPAGTPVFLHRWRLL